MRHTISFLDWRRWTSRLCTTTTKSDCDLATSSIHTAFRDNSQPTRTKLWYDKQRKEKPQQIHTSTSFLDVVRQRWQRPSPPTNNTEPFAQARNDNKTKQQRMQQPQNTCKLWHKSIKQFEWNHAIRKQKTKTIKQIKNTRLRHKQRKRTPSLPFTIHRSHLRCVHTCCWFRISVFLFVFFSVSVVSQISLTLSSRKTVAQRTARVCGVCSDRECCYWLSSWIECECVSLCGECVCLCLCQCLRWCLWVCNERWMKVFASEWCVRIWTTELCAWRLNKQWTQTNQIKQTTTLGLSGWPTITRT